MTNGSVILPGVSRNTAEGRRLHDLIELFSAELGHTPCASEIAAIKTAAVLTMRAEFMGAAAVRGEPVDGDELIRLSGTARRALAALKRRGGSRRGRKSLGDRLMANERE